MTEQRKTSSVSAARLRRELTRLSSEIRGLDELSGCADRVRLEQLAVRLKSISRLISERDRASRELVDGLRVALEAHVRRRAAAEIASATAAAAAAVRPSRSTSAEPDETRIEVALALHDPFSIDIRVVLCRDGSELAVSVDRVLGRRPFCVAWLVVENDALARQLGTAGWTLWRPDASVESRKRQGVVGADQLPAHGALVATLRHQDVAEFARLASVRCRLIADRATPIAVRADQCTGEEYRRRSEALEVEHRAQRSASTSGSGPRLATCAGCGRPLTDPASARRGYGPVCCGKATGTRARAMVRREDPLVFVVAGIPLPEWQRTLRRALAAAGPVADAGQRTSSAPRS